jgi:hypothetical protein
VERWCEYTVFYADGRAALIHASTRSAALTEAREFRPSSCAERIFDGWRTYCAHTDAVLAQLPGRPGKGLPGDGGPAGEWPVRPRRPPEQRRPPVLLVQYAAHHLDGAVTRLHAADPTKALGLARSYYRHSPVTHLHDGTHRTATAEIDGGTTP